MIVKNKQELNKIKSVCNINNECLFYLKELTVPGISTLEIDIKAEEFYKKNKAIPAFKDYHGYPATINFMRNSGVVHCIPNAKELVESGDVISIDTGCIFDDYYADQALSFGVGEISTENRKLINIAKLSVEAGTNQCTTQKTLGDIGYAQQSVIEMAGLSVVKKFVGHEIGRNLHENLKIPAYGNASSGPKLQENMLVCIENQVCVGSNEVYTDTKDGWSTYTKDGKNSATFEHMVIIGRKKPIILTKFE